MYASITSEQVPVLTQQEVVILIALAGGRRIGYDIKRQCGFDSQGRLLLGNATLYPALKRLAKAGFIQAEEPRGLKPGRNVKVFDLTETGAMLLEWQLETYQRMAGLGDERLRAWHAMHP